MRKIILMILVLSIVMLTGCEVEETSLSPTKCYENETMMTTVDGESVCMDISLFEDPEPVEVIDYNINFIQMDFNQTGVQCGASYTNENFETTVYGIWQQNPNFPNKLCCCNTLSHCICDTEYGLRVD